MRETGIGAANRIEMAARKGWSENRLVYRHLAVPDLAAESTKIS